MRPFPFQQATVDAAVDQLQGKGKKRFLVADEVGLGKTVVAREVIRKLSGGGSKRFTIYYVTSNTKVSDQNARRLVDFLVDPSQAVSRVDRLALTPSERPNIALRLHPFSPTTSFAPLTARPQTGKAGERAFVSWLLHRCYRGILEELPEGLLRQRAKSGWEKAVYRACPRAMKVSIRFVSAYRSKLVLEFGHNARKRIVEAAEQPENWLGVLSRLRRSLAEACLLARPPDLVVFDEFQRYRELLAPAKEDRLARALLNGENGRRPAVLLLSATPYRLFSESWEISGGAQPHEELFSIIEFLGGPAVRNNTESLFRHFGSILRRIGETSGQPLDSSLIETAKDVRTQIEAKLRPLIARTERHGNGYDHGSGTRLPEHTVESVDLRVFRHFASAVSPKFRIAAVPYWLSVPLPAQALGSRYRISKGVEFEPHHSVPAIRRTRRGRRPRDGWGSSKLRALLKVLPLDQLALPWVAPSLEWWPLGGAWRGAPSPKLLMFSRFRATPQSVAGLVSLEVESRYARKEGDSYNKAWKRRKLQARANGASTLTLFHPSKFLIEATDPLKGHHATRAQAHATVKRQLVIRLKQLGIAHRPPRRAESARRKPLWQVLAAIEKTNGTFDDNLSAWRVLSDDEGVVSTLLDRCAEVQPLEWISKRELDDLASMALGGPGIVAGRAWLRHYNSALDSAGLATLTRFCWVRLRNYLDNPVFWRRLRADKPTAALQAAVIDGGLESLLDEQFWLARTRVPPHALLSDLHDALGATAGWFVFKDLPAGPSGVRVRCHAAVPFGGTDSGEDPLAGDDNTRPARSHELRQAFNAPFWPHLLATTSVGQEGLDFHNWCQKIVHWDLPSNPVDLEQREGRISRFGGLAVRRPLARLVGPCALADTARAGGSPWCHLEQHARMSHSDDAGLSPWWLLQNAAIERYAFSLPQSRDVARFHRLRRQRLLYRVVLGQPDQEDLVDLLASGDEERTRVVAALTLNLSPYQAAQCASSAPARSGVVCE